MLNSVVMLYTADAKPNEVLVTSTPRWDDEQDIISNLTCICIVGIEDPVRSEVFLLSQNFTEIHHNSS